jgi:hypothetical protein
MKGIFIGKAGGCVAGAETKMQRRTKARARVSEEPLIFAQRRTNICTQTGEQQRERALGGEMEAGLMVHW